MQRNAPKLTKLNSMKMSFKLHSSVIRSRTQKPAVCSTIQQFGTGLKKLRVKRSRGHASAAWMDTQAFVHQFSELRTLQKEPPRSNLCLKSLSATRLTDGTSEHKKKNATKLPKKSGKKPSNGTLRLTTGPISTLKMRKYAHVSAKWTRIAQKIFREIWQRLL